MTCSRVYQRSQVFGLFGKRGGHSKEEWEVTLSPDTTKFPCSSRMRRRQSSLHHIGCTTTKSCLNPYKIKVILETLVPSSKKELQRLTGHLVAFERFIAYFTDKPRPFFLMLRGVSTCGWTDECKQTFEVVKRYLIEPPIRSSPKSDKQLYMYLVVSDCVAHQVIVLTNQPLRVTLHKLDLSGRMLTWAIELSEHGIKYQSRLALKGQNLKVDTLAGIIATLFIREAIILPVHLQATPSIILGPVCSDNEADLGWIQDIVARFTLINDHLYRQSFGGPYLRCLSDLKPKYVLTELHEGINDRCQRYAPIPHIPSEALNPITSPWLFVLWGMDKIDPLLVVVAQKKFLLKRKTMPTSRTRMFPSSFGKTSCVGSESHERLWQILDCNLAPIGATHFAFAYGMEVVIPIEIGMPTAKTVVQSQRDNDEEIEIFLDWVDEIRGNVAIRMASYRQRAIANWEWPYVVTKAGDSRTYHLQTLDNVPLLRPWNVCNLKLYYQ
uniref:Reverse transcriptase/retrotransposon-derived protein RNase H-like domain-containing protein n=1 Tax=Vitis vinifera TaxID=29760 RepID=A5B7I5_VITVI|nr:hypothetical protein VITISV_004409 [Vitis vinifera]